MFFSINLSLILLFLAIAFVGGYFAGRASHSVLFGILVGLAILIVLIAASILIAWQRTH